jgi:LacI family transcriptional regulator
MHPPNLKTLARQLDLSVTTVSRALKDGPEVRPETAARVKAAAAALGYRPDPRGVSLRTGRTGVVAVLFWEPHVDDVGDSSITAIVEGVCRRLEGTARTAMVQLLLPGMDGVDRVSRIVEGRLADGIILSGTRPRDERVRYMQERRFPFVTFGRTELPEPHPWYDIDNELAAREATEHLIGLGCRRIATLDPPRGLSFAEHRLRGYRQALAGAGLAFDPGLVVHTGLGAAEARAVTRDLMALPAPPTGVVCATGVVALGVLAGLRDLGLVPMRDVAVVSRDGTRLAGYLDPPLPTCFASLSDTGWHLCDLLLRAMEGEPPAALQQLVPTRLILPEGEGRDGGRAPRRRSSEMWPGRDRPAPP